MILPVIPVNHCFYQALCRRKLLIVSSNIYLLLLSVLIAGPFYQCTGFRLERRIQRKTIFHLSLNVFHQFSPQKGTPSSNRKTTWTSQGTHAWETPKARWERFREWYGVSDDCQCAEEKRHDAWEDNGPTRCPKRFGNTLLDLDIIACSVFFFKLSLWYTSPSTKIASKFVYFSNYCFVATFFFDMWVFKMLLGIIVWIGEVLNWKNLP